jgi:hypothetical protein
MEWRRFFGWVPVVLTGALLTLSCGGDSNPAPPTAPTRQLPQLSITTFTSSLTSTSAENRYSVRISVRETGGQTGATLGALSLTFTDATGRRGTASPDAVWPATRLNPGTTLDARAITITDSSSDRTPFVRATASIAYTDDAQAPGSVASSIDISQPPTPPTPPPAAIFTVAGVVSEDPDRVPISGGVVQVVDGPNAGRSSTTDGNGYYSIPGLRTGSFTVRATKSGYRTTDRGLTLANDTRVDIGMASLAPPPPAPPPSSLTCGQPAVQPACGTATARCKDGTLSCSQNHSGTCSHHQGVECWICPGALCKR